MTIPIKHKIILLLLLLSCIFLGASLLSTKNNSETPNEGEEAKFSPTARVLNETKNTEDKKVPTSNLSQNIYLTKEEMVYLKELIPVVKDLNTYYMLNYTEQEIYDKEEEYIDFIDSSVVGLEFLQPQEQWQNYLFLEGRNLYSENIVAQDMYVGKILDSLAPSEVNFDVYDLQANDILYEISFISKIDIYNAQAVDAEGFSEKYTKIISRFFITKDFKIKKFVGDFTDVYE